MQLTKCFPSDFVDSATFPIMAAMVIHILLLSTAIFNVCHAQPQCKTTDICLSENTRRTSTASSLVPRVSIYPASSPMVCSQMTKCFATTYDQATENCELYKANVYGSPCLILSSNDGSSFWVMKIPEIPCQKVRCKKQPASYKIDKSVNIMMLQIKFLM